jgi:N-terminal barrel of NtMGAM and CtMGAM, maltase-glucoamylase
LYGVFQLILLFFIAGAASRVGATLQQGTLPEFGQDFAELVFESKRISSDILQVKIAPKNHSRWEIPSDLFEHNLPEGTTLTYPPDRFE